MTPPEPTLRHLQRMTDDTSLFEHAIGALPHRSLGIARTTPGAASRSPFDPSNPARISWRSDGWRSSCRPTRARTGSVSGWGSTGDGRTTRRPMTRAVARSSVSGSPRRRRLGPMFAVRRAASSSWSPGSARTILGRPRTPWSVRRSSSRPTRAVRRLDRWSRTGWRRSPEERTTSVGPGLSRACRTATPCCPRPSSPPATRWATAPSSTRGCGSCVGWSMRDVGRAPDVTPAAGRGPGDVLRRSTSSRSRRASSRRPVHERSSSPRTMTGSTRSGCAWVGSRDRTTSGSRCSIGKRAAPSMASSRRV